MITRELTGSDHAGIRPSRASTARAPGEVPEAAESACGTSPAGRAGSPAWASSAMDTLCRDGAPRNTGGRQNPRRRQDAGLVLRTGTAALDRGGTGLTVATSSAPPASPVRAGSPAPLPSGPRALRVTPL